MHNIPHFLMITPEMQEHFANGGYIVKRSHDRKGKTHVVIGPDGTKKYFGDSKLGQHPNDPARKKAFYARHKHNLAHNPYFRAFARATWEDGGEVPHFDNGGYYGGFYGKEDAAKMQGWRSPIAADTAATTFAHGGLNIYGSGTVNAQVTTANSGTGINTTTPATSPATAQSSIIDPNSIDDDPALAALPNMFNTDGTGQNIQLAKSAPSPLALMQTRNPGSFVNTQKPAGLATINPNTPVQDITQGLETPEQKAEREKQERYNRARQVNRGAGLFGLGAIGLTKELTNVNPYSPESAVLDFTRQSLDNSINRLAVREANKGIAYGKYGGKLVDKYKDYNEGDIIDSLTPTDRYALEKLGYQFQILNK